VASISALRIIGISGGSGGAIMAAWQRQRHQRIAASNAANGSIICARIAA